MLAILIFGMMFVGLALVSNKGRNSEISFEHPYDRVRNIDQERARVNNNAEVSFEFPYSPVLTK
jgi:hypothetical protein